MKRISTILMALSILSVQNSLNAQPYVYNFNGNLNEAGGAGPTLLDVNDPACTLSNGSFGSQTINTSTGTCGASAQTTFDFPAGDGLSFDNALGQITGTYTIHMLFKFNALTGFQRVLDFHNGGDDNGLYTNNDCLRLFPVSGVTETLACPNFGVAGTFHLVSIVRDGGTSTVKLYIDGIPDATYLDDGSNNGEVIYAATSGVPIRFFLDNTAGCEDRDGSIKYLSLSPNTSTDAQVSNTFVNICSTILPLNLVNFAANKQGSSVVLSWTTENEINTSHFEVERGSVSNKFVKLADIPSTNTSGENNYSFVDNQPLPGTGFYRIRMVDLDGGFKYTGILKINFDGLQKFEVYPNPVTDVLTLSGIQPGGRIKVLNGLGREVMQKLSMGESTTVDISKFPAGLYYIQYYDGVKTENKKIVKN
ncbi:MAG: T9SS type A sorting domain-containing protein [Chitinophagales bacterium]